MRKIYSAWLGVKGTASSSILAASGVRPALWLLQRTQVVTRLFH